MSSAIQLINVGKRYLLEYRKRISLKESFLNLHKGISRCNEFWALKDITLNIPKGQALGIIGKNGSGKTTLLKLLCGVTKPTKGSLEINGKVGGLLELGAGFQGDLTGRENIYLNGSILGLSRKEMQRDIDSIIDFADIGDFIDTAVRTYSTGMYVRLGFAIAMQLEPDILLIDEVLAVGDEAFQRKCIEKIKEFRKRNKTIIFVSHSLDRIHELCDRALLLNKGMVYKDGHPLDVIRAYQVLMENIDKIKEKYLRDKVEIRNVYFLDANNIKKNTFKTGEKMTIRIEYIAFQRVKNPVFGIAIHREDGTHITGPNTKFSGFKIDSIEGKGTIDFIIESLHLLPAIYEVSVRIHTYDQKMTYDYCRRLFKFSVIEGMIKEKYGLVTLPNKWKLKEDKTYEKIAQNQSIGDSPLL